MRNWHSAIRFVLVTFGVVVQWALISAWSHWLHGADDPPWWLRWGFPFLSLLQVPLLIYISLVESGSQQKQESKK